MIHRQTGFSVAYIGSSNISQAALTDGLEWNVKISEYEAPHLWAKVCATFETYWNDPEFVSYSAESREQLRIALREERHGDEERTAFFFDIKPYTYQEAILEKFQAERTIHNRYRNLLVAAMARERRSSLDSITPVPRRRTRPRGGCFLLLIGKRF